MTLIDLIRQSASSLQKADVHTAQHYDNPIDEARELVLHALHLPHDFPSNYAAAKLLPGEVAAVQALVQRRIDTRIPAAYLTGTAYFAGLAFHTDARALIPRSPLGELIQHGLADLLGRTPRNILDLCTGSGCIGIACAHYFPQSCVTLADISTEALALAAENVARCLGLSGTRVQLLQSDLFAALPGRTFDLILSNPPYITDADYTQMAPEYRHEPKLGLTSGHDGLDHPLAILRAAAKHLTPGGHLLLEVGEAWHALRRLLPKLDIRWLEFSVGVMGIGLIDHASLQAAQADLDAVCVQRNTQT
jgi:ribosomal protein L3 glutamine methyltransferase